MHEHSSEAVFGNPSFDGHEQVVFVRDRASGLNAIIAIHSTRLGPALGGCRLWPYQNEEAALRDALRLSRGMSYKNALARLDYGGAKAVIIADARDKSPALLRAFARAVESLGGRYIAGADVGISGADIEIMHSETAHVRGLGGRGIGDPSPYTARGVLAGMRAAAARRFGSESLGGLRIAVQGLGKVGSHLCHLLRGEGARLVISDIDSLRVGQLADRFGADVVPPGETHAADCDILAPCALGGILNKETIPEIRARVVAGAANNQLDTGGDGERLMEHGILYAPDYAINAGGAIAVAHEGQRPRQAIVRQVEAIGATLARIFALAEANRCPTSVIADLIAEERLDGLRAA